MWSESSAKCWVSTEKTLNPEESVSTLSHIRRGHIHFEMWSWCRLKLDSQIPPLFFQFIYEQGFGGKKFGENFWWGWCRVQALLWFKPEKVGWLFLRKANSASKQWRKLHCMIKGSTLYYIHKLVEFLLPLFLSFSHEHWKNWREFCPPMMPL